MRQGLHVPVRSADRVLALVAGALLPVLACSKPAGLIQIDVAGAPGVNATLATVATVPETGLRETAWPAGSAALKLGIHVPAGSYTVLVAALDGARCVVAEGSRDNVVSTSGGAITINIALAAVRPPRCASPADAAPAAPDAGSDGPAADTRDSAPPDLAAPVDLAEAAPPPSCNPLSPFTVVGEVNINTAQTEFAGTLTGNERTLFFATGVLGDKIIIRQATRDDPGQPFTNVTTVALGGPAMSSDVDPTISPDGRFLYFASNREPGAGTLGFDLYVAARSDPQAPFGAPTRINAVSTPAIEAFPFVAARGDELFWVRSNGMPAGIRRSAIVGGAVSPAETAPVDTVQGGDQAPVLSWDGETLYFSRFSTNGSADVFVARREPSGERRFVSATAAGGVLNLPDRDERPAWISSDNCRLYFTRTRPGSFSDRDFYMAQRNP